MYFSFMRRSLMALATAGAVLNPGSLPFAQQVTTSGYPNRPIRFVVPFPAGTSPDVLARVIGTKLSESWGQPVVIENRPGAAGMIGTGIAAKAPADGYTVLFAVLSIMAFNPHVYAKVPYDTFKDFAPLTEIAIAPHVLIATPSFPANSLNELIQMAASQPGKIDFASAGVGSGPHLMMETFSRAAKINLTHIPFKSNGLSEVMAGQVSISFDPLVTSLPQIKAGKVKALAVSESVPQLPNVPTISTTVPGFSVGMWHGAFVQSTVPKDIVAKLNSEFVKIIRSPDVQARFADWGLRTVAGTPEEFKEELRRDYPKWGNFIKELGIKVDL